MSALNKSQYLILVLQDSSASIAYPETDRQRPTRDKIPTVRDYTILSPNDSFSIVEYDWTFSLWSNQKQLIWPETFQTTFDETDPKLVPYSFLSISTRITTHKKIISIHKHIRNHTKMIMSEAFDKSQGKRNANDFHNYSSFHTKQCRERFVRYRHNLPSFFIIFKLSNKNILIFHVHSQTISNCVMLVLAHIFSGTFNKK